jgi:cell division protein FtsB
MTLVFLGLALYLGGTVLKLCWQEWNLQNQAHVLQAERVEVQAQNDELNKEIAASRTNAGIERLAREELGLVMAAEIPVKTTQPPPPPPAPTVKEPAAPNKQPARIGLPPAMASLAKFFTPLWQ